jgi:hypothetical protein
MTNIGVFGVYQITFAFPGKDIAINTARKSIVPESNNNIMLIGYHRAGLCCRIFGAVSYDISHAHKTFVPGDIIVARFDSHKEGINQGE